MAGVDVAVGVLIILIGGGFFTIEIFHPGALLLIPATIMIVGGFLYLLIPDVLLRSIWGPIAILVAALIATVVTILYYRWLAGVHKPLSTTSGGLVGEEGIIVADVVPNTLRGKVRIRSEIWSAKADAPIRSGTAVRVIAGEGVSVTVEPLGPSQNS
ncbi:MAG TPA: NfeD family protein [Thermoplasmata archaeon]|nr:NfeD family protein [Thermoplasmata archaeon]